MNLLFLDCEIARCIPSHRIADDPETDPDQSDRMMYQFCHGWTDFSGMGISCVTTFSTIEARAHVYLRDNLAELIESIRAHDHVVTFNGDRFDIPLLRANDIMVHQHIDLAKAIWSACGIANGEHPRNLGLNALCLANRIAGKTGNGANAPKLFQDGCFGQLIDYCLGDTIALLRLWRSIQDRNGFYDPRIPDGMTQEPWIHMRLPR